MRLHCNAKSLTATAAVLLAALHWPAGPAVAQDRTLTDISYAVLSASEVQVTLSLSGDAPTPGSFTIDNPARIAVDLPGTKMGLANRNLEINTGTARSIRAVESGGRTRVVLSLTEMVPYNLVTAGNEIRIMLGGTAVAQRAPDAAQAAATGRAAASWKEIYGVDFRRDEKGGGQVIVTLDPAAVVDMQEQGDQIVLNFFDSKIPDRLVRRLNVVDFATPVHSVDTFETDTGSKMVIRAQPPFEHMGYQTGNRYTVEVKPVTPAEVARRAADYVGERLSLNFQAIEVRAVLQLIADFTGMNVVASDSVQGTITLRLKNVPWDQALDIILKTKGLGMRKAGNVVLIAPNDELAAREKQELEAQKQMVELAPVRTEFFQVNYAKAADIAKLLKSGENSILSNQGRVTIDERTNTLMILETNDKLDEIAGIIQKLDIPVRQVLIESRVVIASDDFTRSFGVRSGVTNIRDTSGGPLSPNSTGVTSITGSARGNEAITGSAINNLASTGGVTPLTMPGLADRLNVNFPVAGPTLALAVLGSDYLVDLELSALQQEGKGEVLSNPRVITSNQKKARIEQGVELPYREASSSGAATTAFKKAVLSLEVTPQITPDDRVLLDLTVTKDAIGEVVFSVPTINKRAITTQVLVSNGDTIVLGGVYEQTTRNDSQKVPFLGDLPFLGFLFKSTEKIDDKAELLIFVTPKILKEGLSAEL